MGNRPAIFNLTANKPSPDILTIRPVQRGDIDTITDLFLEREPGVSPDFIADNIRMARDSFIAFAADGTLAGAVLAGPQKQYYPDGIGLTCLILSPAARNTHHCATELVAHLIRHCESRGQKTLNVLMTRGDTLLQYALCENGYTIHQSPKQVDILKCSVR